MNEMKIIRVWFTVMSIMLIITAVVACFPTHTSVQGALPAVVNPTGWDKPGICKKLDVLIGIAKDKQSIGQCANRLQGYVCDLPTPMYTDLMDILRAAPRIKDGIVDDDKLTLLLLRQSCLLFKINIMMP
jgi:hypothetical protein